MMSLSLWAARNKWTARIILIISYLLLIGMAILVSDLLSETKTVLPGFLFSSAILVYLIAAAMYPSKKEKRYKNYYFRKACDLMLVSCSLLMIICTGYLKSQTSSSSLSVVSAASNETASELVKKKKKSIKKEQIKKIKALYKELKAAYKNGPKGTKALLIILTVIVGIGLLLLVLAASCSLACSGMGGASVLVGVLGTGLVIFFL